MMRWKDMIRCHFLQEVKQNIYCYLYQAAFICDRNLSTGFPLFLKIEILIGPQLESSQNHWTSFNLGLVLLWGLHNMNTGIYNWPIVQIGSKKKSSILLKQ